MQVHEGEHLGHLGGLAGPRRQDRAAEPHRFPRLLVDPAVVDPWGPDLDGSRPGHERPGIRMTVAHHEAVAPLVALVGQRGHVGIDLGLEGGGQHPPRPLRHQLVQRGRRLRVRGLLNMYSQHRRSFLAGVPPPAFPLVWSKRKVRRASSQVVHPQVSVITHLSTLRTNRRVCLKSQAGTMGAVLYRAGL